MKRTCRQLLAAADPAVIPDSDDCLSDEAVVEDISEGSVMWVLLEVKGSNYLPAQLRETMRPFFQAVGLALQSEMWKKKILGGLVTRELWYLAIQDQRHVIKRTPKLHARWFSGI